MLRYKAATVAEERLMALNIATISQCGDKDVYERFVAGLCTEDVPTNEDEFDRGALERLRGRVERR